MGCRCGARAAKFAKKLGEPSRLGLAKLFTERAWRTWWQSYQGNNCDRAGLAELKFARMEEAQPTHPADKRHLLLNTGGIKWCWRCGARAERNSAPRVLLKTACSGALRTEEYERAHSLLGKGQHPKRSVLKGRPTPISDEEWDQWLTATQFVFLSPRAVEALTVTPVSTSRARLCVTCQRRKQK